MRLLRPALLLAFCCALPAGSAYAAPPAKTDVALIFDTTGSMDEAIYDAQQQVRDVMDRLSARIPDVQFALGEVRDYALGDYGDYGDVPWRVVQPMTADRAAMQDAVDDLDADGGGDGPEAYGRALFEAEVGDGMGWRPGARRVAIVVADSVPHDDDLNEGVPESIRTVSSPYDTGIDPGRDELFGTPDDIDWQQLLGRLNERGLPLMLVLYQGTASRLGYWNHWAGLTGGEAMMGSDSDSETLADRLVRLAESGATKDLGPCPRPGDERGTDGMCRVQPVVFLPGIMGSELWCGDRKLWFEYRLGTGIDHKALLLAGDGRSPARPADPCNASAGPKAGQILSTVLGSDVYSSTVARFQQQFGAAFSTFSYDWRKSPGDSIGALDRYVDELRAANGGVHVRLAAHSMGGLVVRWFLDDPVRAAKVSRAVTVGTPYLGSPKSVLPFARGETDPGLQLGLDTLLGNGEVKEMTANFAGLYALLPSAAWHAAAGDWLTMRDQSRKPLPGPAKTASGMKKQWTQVNTTLYGQATAAHRALDGFKTNGVAELAVIGAGKPTIAGLTFDENLLRRDTYDWSYGNGDGTVPLVSAAQGSPAAPPLGEPVARRYRCGIEHGKLTGNEEVFAAAAEFLTTGATSKLSDQPCSAAGDEITFRAVPTSGAARAAAGTGALSIRVGAGPGAPALKLSEAEAAGLVEVVENEPSEAVVVVTRGVALQIAARGRQLTATTRALTDATATAPVVYGPTDAALTVTTGAATAATRNGKPLKARRADRRAPKTTLRVRRRGRGAVLRFAARDSSRVRMTLVRVGGKKAARLKGKTLRIARIGRRGVLVRYQSVDAYGNTEPVRSRRIAPARKR